MGSVASYEASVVLVYKRKLNVKDENSDADIEAFLAKYGGKYGKVVDVDDSEIIYTNIENGKYLGFVGNEFGYDESSRQVDTFEYEFEEFVDPNAEIEDIQAIVLATKEDLKFVDLDIAAEFNYLPTGSVNKEIEVGGLYESIYCDNDNSSTDIVKLTPKMLQDLSNRVAHLEIRGNGSGDGC